jgi:hypothetical protein
MCWMEESCYREHSPDCLAADNDYSLAPEHGSGESDLPEFESGVDPPVGYIGPR